MIHVAIENYRGFTKLDVEFHPQLNVIVGENSKGKTALLDSIAIGLEPFVAIQIEDKETQGIDAKDMRVESAKDGTTSPAGPTKVRVVASVNGKQIDWTRERINGTNRGRTKDSVLSLLENSREMRDQARATDTRSNTLPVIAFYGTDRALNLKPPKKGNQWSFAPTAGPEVGYWDYIRPSSTFDSFVEWYRWHMNELRKGSHVSNTANAQSIRFITAVNQTIESLLSPTEWCTLAWDFDKDNRFGHDALAVVSKSSGVRLPLRSLSDGVRNVLSLAADLTHRCVRLNPHLKTDAASQTPGVVLIDEIDLHLHPAWQQQIVPLFQQAFPAIQFIMSTHSPQVLSTVHKDSIRVIRVDSTRYSAEPPSQQTLGVENADVLARVMLVDPIPKVKAAQQLSDYRALLQKGEQSSAGATGLWEELVAHFGEGHPILEDIDVFRRLQEFKKANGIPL